MTWYRFGKEIGGAEDVGEAVAYMADDLDWEFMDGMKEWCAEHMTAEMVLDDVHATLGRPLHPMHILIEKYAAWLAEYDRPAIERLGFEWREEVD